MPPVVVTARHIRMRSQNDRTIDLDSMVDPPVDLPDVTVGVWAVIQF